MVGFYLIFLLMRGGGTYGFIKGGATLHIRFFGIASVKYYVWNRGSLKWIMAG